MELVEKILKVDKLVALYTLMLLMVFSPSKAVGQVVGVVCIGLLLFFVRVDWFQSAIKISFFLMLYISLGLIYFLFKDDFLFFNHILFLITASSVLLLCFDFRNYVNSKILSDMVNISFVVLCIESLYGILQAIVAFTRTRSFDVGNGDLVRGTIDPTFRHVPSASNPIFAILISSLLLFVIIFTDKRSSNKRFFIISITIIACILASVMHVILFLFISFFVIFVLRGLLNFSNISIKSFQKIVSIAFVCMVLLTFMLILFPRNISLIPYLMQTSVDISPFSSSEKSRATYNTLFLISDTNPTYPWIGLGPGQYSSRASLIRSGEYLNQSLPFIQPTITQEANNYILSLWKYFLATRPNGGSSFFPFYSWLSLYAEFGIFGFIIFIIFSLYFILRMLKMSSKLYPQMNLWIPVLFLFVLLLGIQDNYWEFTQAVFPACFIIKICYDFMRTSSKLNN